MFFRGGTMKYKKITANDKVIISVKKIGNGLTNSSQCDIMNLSNVICRLIEIAYKFFITNQEE